MSTNSEVFSGARAVLKLGGKIVGYALACTGSTAINYAPIEGLGSLAVLEHVPVGYTVEFTAQLARLARFTRLAEHAGTYPNRDGYASASEKNAPRLMPAYGSDGLGILKTGEMTAVIQDVVSGESVYTIKGVKGSTKGWDVSARAPVNENVTFVARLMAENSGGTVAESDLAIDS